MSDEVSPIAKLLASLSDGITRIARSIEALETVRKQNFATLQESLQELRKASEEVTSGQSKMRSEIMARIDRLQDTLELVRDDARVNWATADTAINRARNSREDINDLQKLIAAMERRYQTLASLVDGLRKADKPDDQI